MEACKAEGLKTGLYLFRPGTGTNRRTEDSPRYNDYYVGQLTELLTWYGPIREVWFDGANGEGPNGKRQVYADWERIHRHGKATPARGRVIFSDAGPISAGGRSNENGVAGDP